MEHYVDRDFVEYNKAAYCRMHITFDMEEERLYLETSGSSQEAIGWRDSTLMPTK
jgi:hypothetical protein